MQTNKAFLVVAVLVLVAMAATVIFLMNDSPAKGDSTDVLSVDGEQSRATESLPQLDAEGTEAEAIALEDDDEPKIFEIGEFVNATLDNPDDGRPTFIRTRDTMGNIILAEQQWRATKGTGEKMPKRIRGVARLAKARKHPGGVKMSREFKPVKKTTADGKKDGDSPSVDGENKR